MKAIGGYLKQVSTDGAHYKCWGSEDTYTARGHPSYFKFSRACSSDPGFYQTCGHLPTTSHTWNYNSAVTAPLCSFYVCEQRAAPFLPRTFTAGEPLMDEMHCNRDVQPQCANGAPHLETCDWSAVWSCGGRAGAMVGSESRCDGIRDCPHGEDEVGCGHEYGHECESSSKFLPKHRVWVGPSQMCNPMGRAQPYCKDGSDQDQESCGDQIVGDCTYRTVDKVEAQIRTLFHMQRCGPYNPGLCEDGLDQVNCTNRDITFTCLQSATGHTIHLTDVALCQDLDICQDDINNKCVTPETNCKIHRHFRCDGVAQCDNGLDEEQCEDLRTDTKCMLRVRNKKGHSEKQFILKSWVLDGVQDCEEGEDENSDIWTACKYDATSTTLHIPSDTKCQKTLLCPTNSQLIDPLKLCDGYSNNDCPLGTSSLCKIARGKLYPAELYRHSGVRYLGNCLPSNLTTCPDCPTSNLTSCREYHLTRAFGTVPDTIVAPIG